MSATRAAMEKLIAALNTHGFTTGHIVGVNVYLRKMEHFKIVNQVYQVPACRLRVSRAIEFKERMKESD